jgi:isoquinoline 1-oxidoreductase beta subunit
MLATTLQPSRRGFLVGAAAGLTLGFSPLLRRIASAAEVGPNPFDAYVVIAPDSTVTVLSAHMDMGQGAYTGLATLVAEELDADWAQMRVEGASGNAKLYGNLMWGTGGSTAIPSSWDRYRLAGAAARAMLVEAAAAAWGVPPGQVTVHDGILAHENGKRASFGEFATAAAKLAPPTAPVLKQPAQWAYIGNPNLRRLDSAAKSTGRQAYTIDVQLPGMLTAVVTHPPAFGGKVKSVDATAARQVAGVVDVVEIPRGVAVVAQGMWAAIKGREALQVEWDLSTAETRSSAELMDHYRKLAAGTDSAIARQEGDAEKALAGAAKVVEASFEFPYLAHAAMEPLNAVARLQDGLLEVWGGHQIPDLYQAIAAGIAGVPPGQVKLHVMMTGGGFGRRAVTDADIVAEAVAVGKAIGWRAPVRVQWTREDDMTGGRYRPMYLHSVKAGVDADGNLVGWRHRIVGQSILTGTPFEALAVAKGVDGTSVEGASNLAYAVPHIAVDLVTTTVAVPVLWWRSVGHTHTAYATEVMIDALAAAAGRDPVEFRLAHMQGHPRHVGALRLAAEKAGWNTPLPEGRFRGVAVHESFNTFVAQVAEITLDEQGRPKVERVVCAVDCGVAVNPDVIKAQMEGGIGFGLGAILHQAINLDGGRVVETNFDAYEVLRLDEMPKVEVHIVPSTERPTGVGEPGVPPIGPAVANAYRAATGKTVTVLPFAKGLAA